MSLSFNVLNQAMLTQVLHELRLGNLQRCKVVRGFEWHPEFFLC